jgi:N-acetyl-alpha-D-muramate 1-phosphate uridylyltransferase
MVLSAGLGLRMRPLTDRMPKPLVKVNGRPMIDYAFDRLRAVRCERAVVNVHHFPEQIEAWARRQASPEIIISDERALLLDTGGGIVKALPWLGDDPFFVLNSDSFWLDGGSPALDRLRESWSDSCMDCLLLLSRLDRATGYGGKGDFVRDPKGQLARRTARDDNALVYIGCYLVHPRLFQSAPQGKFSMNLLWDKAIAEGRLHGIVHDGLWLHVGTPDAIALAEAALAA